MALSADQVKRLGTPPRPPGPDVRVVTADGRLDPAFLTYLTALSAWQQRLYLILQEP